MRGFEFFIYIEYFIEEIIRIDFCQLFSFWEIPYAENFEIVPLSERKVIRVRLYSGRSSSKPAFQAGVSN